MTSPSAISVVQPRSLRQLFYLGTKFINLLLDLRHPFHLHVEFSKNVFDMAVDFGGKRRAITRSHLPTFADFAPRAGFSGVPAWADSPAWSGFPARSGFA